MRRGLEVNTVYRRIEWTNPLWDGTITKKSRNMHLKKVQSATDLKLYVNVVQSIHITIVKYWHWFLQFHFMFYELEHRSLCLLFYRFNLILLLFNSSWFLFWIIGHRRTGLKLGRKFNWNKSPVFILNVQKCWYHILTRLAMFGVFFQCLIWGNQTR